MIANAIDDRLSPQRPGTWRDTPEGILVYRATNNLTRSEIELAHRLTRANEILDTINPNEWAPTI